MPDLPDVVRLRNYRHYPIPPKPEDLARLKAGRAGFGYAKWLDYTAPQGQVYIAVILGFEGMDGTPPFPLLAMLRELTVDGVAVCPDPSVHNNAATTVEPPPVGDTHVDCPQCWAGTGGPHPHTNAGG